MEKSYAILHLCYITLMSKSNGCFRKQKERGSTYAEVSSQLSDESKVMEHFLNIISRLFFLFYTEGFLNT